MTTKFKCDWILENESKSNVKFGVLLGIFNDISIYVYGFPKYFLRIKALNSKQKNKYVREYSVVQVAA